MTTATYWSTFGHVIILLLIQIGGLGVMTLMMIIAVTLGQRLTMKDRILIGDSFSLDSRSGVVRFLKRTVKGTLLVEGIGALCYLPVFVHDFGFLRGLWYSIFHAVSAFCNAGIDIMGESSFMPYVHNVWINLVTMILIICGGIGFIVWWDIIAYLKHKKTRLTVHTKIVIWMSVFLIVVGTIAYLAFEYNNPETIGSFTWPQKILAALFQSVTTRTAGFAAISQKGLTLSSVLVTCLLMFIGGSSAGTAGGVKTGTVAVLLLAIHSTIRGRQDVEAFGRRLPMRTVQKALTVVSLSLLINIAALLLMSTFCGGSALDILFEVFSALGTVGLTRDFTGTMNLAGKLIICFCIFIGRIGSMSIVFALTVRSKKDPARLMEEDITVG